MSRKNLIRQPIVRNVLVIIAIFAALVFLGVVAMVGKTVVDWALSLGWTVLITIVITSLVCGIIFGIVEMRNRRKDGYDED